MRQLCRFVFLALLLSALPRTGATQEQALSVGVFPYLSTRKLIETYQPMREFLERRLQRPVTFYTAPDFASFVARTQKGEYDLVATAPHFARLAQTGAGYQPLLTYGSQISAVVVVDRSRRITAFSQLRGKKVIAPDRIALVTMTGLKAFRDHDLEPGRDFSLEWAATHGNVALAVLHGDADAGILSLAVLRQQPEASSGRLVPLAVTAPTSSLVLLSAARIPPTEQARIKKALLLFEQAETGQAFFKANGLKGFRPILPADLAPLDPFAAEVKSILESGK